MLKILFEDKNIIVAYKPFGILSQSDGSNAPDMLSIIKEHIKSSEQKSGNVFLGLVHRIDRNVEGVMVFAKRSKAAARLFEQIKSKEFKKSYVAELEGRLDLISLSKFPEAKYIGEWIELTNFLEKDSFSNTVKVVKNKTENSKESVLKFKVLELKAQTTVVEINLITGRSHQIRAQFSNLGFPLVGDRKYGSKSKIEFIKLCAFRLEFFHPISKEPLKFEITPS